MLFNSVQFLIFLPIVLVIYYIIPKKIKYIWLLLCSYYFYMCWNALYALLILFSTIATYLCGLGLEYIKQIDYSDNQKIKLKKMCVTISLVPNLGILFFFKYFDFFINNINNVLSHINVQLVHPAFDILLPVGISFYTFQAIGYTLDVYRDEIYAEKNFLKYALFVSFFPQLVAGPIERSKNLLKQLSEPAKLQFDNFREGLLLMLWGYFLKVVLADRIAIFVDSIYAEQQNGPDGYFFFVATLLFAFQIYCDFAGYSTIAMGSAKLLGIELMVNFNAPYLSKSTAEFWRRWHISLSSWFKDYLYIPLGGNRKGKIRKYVNLLITFAISGLWHGAAWSYIAWGLLNGIYQIIGEILRPIKKVLIQMLGLNENSFGHKVVKVVITFLCIDFSWIFFRASSFSSAVKIIKSMLCVHNPWILFDGSLYHYGLDRKNFQLMLLGIGILLLVDIAAYKGIKLRKFIAEQDYWCQAVIITFSIISILLFGIWGNTYDAANFIYFQF
ncbi:MAG: MBOAT family protein [Lachnospiraceae bacterium]|nr:MBOAT family protein [Lachnospiraceae bacterium]